MTTCTKRYTDIPFAHRQPNHSGHCALIHGHDWSFEFEFSAKNKDECGFVIDFGKLGDLKAMLGHLDHALVLNVSDPMLGYLQDKLEGNTANRLARIVEVPDCSAEGLAEWALENGNRIVGLLTAGRVSVVRVTCFEDSKNSATATNKMQ